MISKGKVSEEPYENLGSLTEADIAAYYLNISSIPSLINSPLRIDSKPSFSIFSPDGVNVNYRDFSTGECGRIWTLLAKMWNCSYREVQRRVYNDLGDKSYGTKVGVGSFSRRGRVKINPLIDLQCRVREWRDYDIEYWASYGISVDWLKYADVYPISHKIVVKDDGDIVFGADKYAYAYVEFKGGSTTLKIYQPFNTKGFKWANRHDKSVVSLWTKIPKTGDNLIISSSLKDSLNIWCNLGIPSICFQGEGYHPNPKVIEELKSRFKKIIVLFDNDFNNPDNPGRNDSIALCKEFGLDRIEIPEMYKSKDPSDLYKNLGKEKYMKIMNNLLKDKIWKNGNQ